MNDLKARWEHMAEIEWMERYYGVDTWTPERSEVYDADIDLHDYEDIDFLGYGNSWMHEFPDTDWPAIDDTRYRSQFDTEIPF